MSATQDDQANGLSTPVFYLSNVSMVCTHAFLAPTSAFIVVQSTIMEKPVVGAAIECGRGAAVDDDPAIGRTRSARSSTVTALPAGTASRHSRRSGFVATMTADREFDWMNTIPPLLPVVWDPRVLHSARFIVSVHSAENDESGLQAGEMFGQVRHRLMVPCSPAVVHFALSCGRAGVARFSSCLVGFVFSGGRGS